MSLILSPSLALADDLATKTIGILAQRRKGKTYTAAVIAEELVDAGIPFVAIDPTGAWWGLRSSADGTKPGLPVTILGGHHGDVPLERTAGKLVAELVVDRPGWYVLDFSLFEAKEADRQFATDFAERLYRRKGQEGADSVLHVFVDEADLFVPQQSPSGDKRMVGAFETLVRRGGIRGIGTTLISQRAAVVNKNVLEMLDMLVVLRTVGPNDRKAIDGYIEAFATPDQRKTVMASLASLEIGEAWVYEPGEDLLQRVRVRARRTFNSSATPKAGERRAEPQRLADVDLDALKEQMADTIERAEREDPKKLQARIRELERELAERPIETETVTETVEVIPPRLRETILTMSAGFAALAGPLADVMRAAEADADAQPAVVARHVSSPQVRPVPQPSSTKVSPPSASSGETETPSGAPGRILAVLAQFPDGRTRRQVAALAGLAARKSTIRNALSTLRTRGLIEEHGDLLRLTPAGFAAAGGVAPLPTGPELLDYWRSEIGGGAPRAIFDALIDAYPAELTRDEITARTGYSGSTLRNALSKLRSLDLIEGNVRVSGDLMDAIR